MFFPFWDATMLILIPAMLFVFWSQYKVKSTFNKYAEVWAQSGMTGADVARRILRGAGIHDVRVERIEGELTDHYDPRDKVVRLSDSTYDSPSVAAIGVAAHEIGHAIQHDVGYMPLTLRNSFVPLANIGSFAGPWIFMLGLFIPKMKFLMDLGIIAFSLAVFFYLVTLPVEFNASSRALAVLGGDRYLTEDEHRGARAVLTAAALTYVASAAMALSQLLRLILIRNSRDD